MGRDSKVGFEYYSLDVDWYDDDKIHNLEEMGGECASLMWIKLLSNLYGVGCCYRWGEAEARAFARRHHYDLERVKSTVNSMIEVRLFSKEVYENTGFLTSKSIQKRAQKIQKLCRREPAKVPPGVWLLGDEDQELESQNLDQIELNKSKGKERKGNPEKLRINPEKLGINPDFFGKTPNKSEEKTNSHSHTLSDLSLNLESGNLKSFTGNASSNSLNPTNDTSEKEKANVSDSTRSEADLKKPEIPKNDNWLSLAYEKLEEPNKQPWTRTNVFMLDGRRPMRDYPDLFWKPQDLAEVLKIWDATVPKDQWRSGFLSAQSKVQATQKSGKRLEDIPIMSWFLTFIRSDLIKNANDQARLTKSLGGVP